MDNQTALTTVTKEEQVERLTPKPPLTKKKRSFDFIGVLLLFIFGSGMYLLIQALNALMYNAFSPNPLFIHFLWYGLFPIFGIFFLRLLYKKAKKNESAQLRTWKDKIVGAIGVILLAGLICLLISSTIQYFASIYATQESVYQGRIEAFACNDPAYRSPSNTGVTVKLNNGRVLEASYLWNFCVTQREYNIQTFLIGKPVMIATRHNFLGWTVDEIFYNNKSLTSLTQKDLS